MAWGVLVLFFVRPTLHRLFMSNSVRKKLEVSGKADISIICILPTMKIKVLVIHRKSC